MPWLNFSFAGSAAVAAGREGRYGDISLQGLGQGIDYLNNVSQLRLGQQDQMGAIIRGILSGALPRLNTGVLASLISGGFEFAGSRGLESLLGLFGIGKEPDDDKGTGRTTSSIEKLLGNLGAKAIDQIPGEAIFKDLLGRVGLGGEAPKTTSTTGTIPGLEEGLRKQYEDPRNKLPNIFDFPGYGGTPGIIPYY